MTLPFSELAAKHGLSITGVIYVGAHWGEEYDCFKQLGAQRFAMFEPTISSFIRLSQRFGGKDDVRLYNLALGNKNERTFMFTETGNQGQSNSLLEPLTHLTAHPEVKFTGKQEVNVRRLDDMTNDEVPRQFYNMLYMDVQGYELEVLRGAAKTLNGIEYIYTEVNRDELYKGCGKIDELDAFLAPYGFVRVETEWAGNFGWGDALYVRRQKTTNEPLPIIEVKAPEISINAAAPSSQSTIAAMVHVPEEFRPHIKINYPEDNLEIFEEYYQRTFMPIQGQRRIYLPVLWTSYYVNNEYGKNKEALKRLQKFLDKLDKNVPYYTIVQYDDGILNDISHLDLYVFAMSGPKVDYPLPLICQPHNVFSDNTERDIIANFVGSRSHPVRDRLLTLENTPGFYINTQRHSLPDYCRVLARSIFTLCPRGYGQTSFRIAEGLQYGSIPVYISDDFIQPHNVDFNTYGVVIRNADVGSTYEILMSLSDAERKQKIEAGKEIYRKLFTYTGNKIAIDRLVTVPGLRNKKIAPKLDFGSGKTTVTPAKPDHSKKKMAVIIPYRNRPANLKKLLTALKQHPIANPYHIYVVQQSNDGRSFNKGKLLNAGFLLLKDQYDYFCFHDVDLLPVNADYSYPEQPTHLATRASQFGYAMPYPEYFGGVVMFNKADFEAINGSSNMYWGWGKEDDEIYVRCQLRNLNPQRRDGEFLSLEHAQQQIDHMELSSNARNLHETKLGARVIQQDGLNNCVFKVESEQKYTDCTLITVKI